jgi:hypothetical protein
MIRGFFGSDNRPYVVGLVSFPNLSLGPVAVAFLLDTGADKTMIMPLDAVRLGVDFNTHFANHPNSPVGGLGSSADAYDEQAIVALPHEEAGRSDTLQGTIKVAAPSIASLFFPSLLGRDIFDYYVLYYDLTGRNLLLLSRTHPA